MGNLPFEIVVQWVLIQGGKKVDIFYGIWAFFMNVWLSGFKSLESFFQTLSSTFAFKMVPWPLKWNKVKRLVPLLNRIQNSAGYHRLPVDFIINFLCQRNRQKIQIEKASSNQQIKDFYLHLSLLLFFYDFDSDA